MDRIWPRGISKSDAHLDHWLKQLAPSKELRLWFAHDPNKWEEFEERYHAELKGTKSANAEMQIILDHAAKSKVTLLIAARDVEHNNAVALLHYLEMQ